jgi:lipid-A-disaccharide synthase
LIALLAGEASGDLLGAELLGALRTLVPQARFVGIGGPRMRAQGMDCWYDISALSVMGLSEVLQHLPRLLRLRRALIRRLLRERPALTIGIDAPDFNLGLERRLKQARLHTAHYVSPSVWAWREGRAAKLGASADRVLCLFPMEPAIYARYGVDARFVGHPLADHFDAHNDRAAARAALGIGAAMQLLAVLPGSRHGEVQRLLPAFLDAATRLRAQRPALQIGIPAASAALRAQIETALTGHALLSGVVHVLDAQADLLLRAADAALLASGTAALEAALAQCPMVVGYRIAPLTHFIAKRLRLLRATRYSLPNILAGRDIVPELMQDACTGPRLAMALAPLLDDPAAAATQRAAFPALHAMLHAPDAPTAASAAARAALDLLAIST